MMKKQKHRWWLHMSDDRATAVIDRSKSILYDELIRDESSVFYTSSKMNVFVMAACIGFYFKQIIPLPTGSERQDLFVTTTLGGDSQEKLWILKSIAVSLRGITVLKSMREIISVCQEYANFGIDYLYKIHKESDNETSEIAALMADSLDSMIE